MRQVWLTMIILALFFTGYWFFLRKHNTTPDVPQSISSQGPLKISVNSVAFNNSIDSLMTAYLALKDDFVEADSIQAKQAALKLVAATGNVKIDELKKDTSGIYATALSQLGDVTSNAQSLAKQPNITEMRKDFSSVTESLYPLLKMIHYEGNVLYLQNCPMAFGEDHDANWISNTAEIINPYLGKKNPEFKGTMIHCGETKDSIVAK
jgi:hypothetical protein